MSAKVGAVFGAGAGVTSGYAGGVGSIEDMLRGGAIGLGTGAISGAVLQAAAPALSKLAAKAGDITIYNTNITLKDIYNAIQNIKIHPSISGPLNGLMTNISQGLQRLDANRVLFLGGGAALGTGAILNDQALPLLREYCGEGSECNVSGEF